MSVDYSKQENQIGCGYCINEKTCEKRDPKVNKAKLGREDFKHFKELTPNRNGESVAERKNKEYELSIKKTVSK